MKKELDLAQIMRDSIMKANKDLGFLKEQKADSSAFNEDFDLKKHMPSIELSPKKWGVVGTIEANQLDAVLKNIVPQGEQDGLARFKKALENLNKAVGTKFGKTGKTEFTTFEQGETANINEIVSGLMVKNLMHNLITNMPAGAAGSAFEGFVARLTGGYTSNESDKPIQDLVDANGNFISLKLVIAGTEIKGSLSGLAKGIATSPNNKVIYLVCVKDRDNDPFKLTTYSFEVNEENFFKFATGVANPPAEEVSKIKQRIFKDLGIATTVAPTDTSEILKEVSYTYALDSLKDRFEDVFKHYFLSKNPNAEYSRSAVKQYVFGEIDRAQNLTDEEFKLLNLLLNRYKFESKFGGVASEFKERLKNELFTAGDKSAKLVNTDTFARLLTILPKAIKELPQDRLLDILQNSSAGKVFMKDIESTKKTNVDKQQILDKNKLLVYKDYLKSNSDDIKELEKQIPSKVKSELDTKATDRANAEYEKISLPYKTSGAEGRMQQALELLKKEYQTIRNKLSPIIEFLGDIETSIEEIAPESSSEGPKEKAAREKIQTPYASEESKKTSEEAQKLFFSYIKNYYSGDQEESLREAVASETQFLLPQNSVKQITQVDSSYPQVVIEKTELFDSAQKNADLFKKWAEPIYRGMHYLTQGINQYFIEDRPDGLANAEEKGIKEVQVGIEKFKTKQASDLSASGQTPKASELKESKKTSLNDDFLSDILKDLF